MKYIYICLMITLSLTCSSQSKKKIEKTWLGKPVQFDRIREVTNTYHMYDSTGSKVGSMVFGFSFEDGKLVARDTSLFDNGSIYETASFVLDTANFQMTKVNLDMQVGKTSLDLDLNPEGKLVKGLYKITRDTDVQNHPVDSIYSFDVFRGELYMLMHTLNYSTSDVLSFNVFLPTSLSVARSSINYVGEEVIEVPAGKFDCDVILLKADGKMPDNKVWIRKEEPRIIIKFNVPNSKLDINLVSSK